MWLLSTNGLQLVHFHSPDVVPGGYAILSHVWQGAEQSFSDIQLLISQNSSLRDPFVSVKIKETCYIAFNHGYDWVWIDTCCIDKSSSAELSEAINSMFEWYSKAQVCYAYLHDVPHSCHIHAPNSSFRKSKWFTRGWTLQELIAPRYLIFLSSDWLPLGTKSALADLVQDISGVDVDVLTFTRDVTNVSVARRMSWASRRFTTRLEDEAYSLMGIFAINMTTMYGEGAGAFRRLQEEILRHTDDHTLFAWGKMFEGPDVPPGLVTDTQDLTNYLFAPSPSAFKNSAHMCPAPPSAVATAMKTFFPQEIDVEYVRFQAYHSVSCSHHPTCRLPHSSRSLLSVSAVISQLLTAAYMRSPSSTVKMITTVSSALSYISEQKAGGVSLIIMSVPRLCRTYPRSRVPCCP